MLKSDVYITLEENDSHLLIRGELRLLEKLLKALRSDHAELQQRERGGEAKQRRGKTDR